MKSFSLVFTAEQAHLLQEILSDWTEGCRAMVEESGDEDSVTDLDEARELFGIVARRA
jgi:hypothetical protein